MIFFVAGIIVVALGILIGGYTKDSQGEIVGGPRGINLKWKKNPKQAVALLGVVLIAISCFVQVPTGHTGIVTTFGRVEDYTFEAGIHFKAPWHEIIKMDNRNQKGTQELACFSSDIQEVNMIYTINYQIDKTNAQTIYRTIGVNYYDTVIVPRIQEAVKAITAQYDAENLVSSRDELALKIEEELKVSLAEYNIELINASIENIDFTDAFTTAVEEKQVAVQNKLKAEAEAAAKIIAAQATADANKLLETSITDKILMQQLIDKWDGKYPTVMGGESDIMFDISSLVNSTGE
jgi:regulator of protease activity HflC (stomatin/prohibitin superfamily)